MSALRSTILALTLAAALAGCQRTYVAAPIDTNYPADDADKELDFWHTLPQKSAVCNDEGLHGLILLADGEDKTGGYPARVTLAKERNWLGKGFDEPGNLSMQRGNLARAICVICDIDGGVMMRVFGPIPRYATRELVYMRMMGDPSTENLAITGLEYMGVISKAQDYMMLEGDEKGENKGEKKAAMPSQPAATAPVEPAK